MHLLSSCAVLLVESPLGLLRLLVGACTCGFMIASESLFSMLEILATSCAQWLFSFSSMSSDSLGDAVAIDEGRGSVSL